MHNEMLMKEMRRKNAEMKTKAGIQKIFQITSKEAAFY